MKFVIVAALATAAVQAQQLDLSSLDRLASKAKESANVTLDPQKLQLASGLLAQQDPKSEAARKLVSDLRGVYVRSFEFENTGQYSQADLDAVRAQLKGPNWSRIIDIREKDESVEIWFYTEGGKAGGFALLAAEPRELSVINIVGPLDMASLGRLGATLGIPMLGGSPMPTPKPATAPKKDEDDDE
jgi:hypothetical protein